MPLEEDLVEYYSSTTCIDNRRIASYTRYLTIENFKTCSFTDRGTERFRSIPIH